MDDLEDRTLRAALTDLQMAVDALDSAIATLGETPEQLRLAASLIRSQRALDAERSALADRLHVSPSWRGAVVREEEELPASPSGPVRG